MRTLELQRLLDQAWRMYRRSEESGHPFLVRPSIPVLFFGDSHAYFRSPVRFITVGLNPSRHEFPLDGRFSRFPAADPSNHLRSGVDGGVLDALNAYFRTKPLRPWFGWYEEMLRGAGASYYNGAPNTALHTDVCSPLATDPTWSRLAPDDKDTLVRDGRGLWHELVRALAPDVILVSVARHHLERIVFDPIDDWHTAYTVERKNPYDVSLRRVHVVSDKITTVVFGRAANMPFGTVSAANRRSIGQEIRRCIDAR